MTKQCPECGADVEGLLYRCDLCGTSLQEKKKRLFTCGIYELPQCLGFSALTYEMIDALQPEDPERYADLLEEVGIRMICYPKWMLADMNIKDRLRYSQKKKYAGITVTVDLDGFVYADREEKACMVATALLQAIHSLEARLNKSNASIDGIVKQAELVLGQHIT